MMTYLEILAVTAAIRAQTERMAVLWGCSLDEAYQRFSVQDLLMSFAHDANHVNRPSQPEPDTKGTDEQEAAQFAAEVGVG